MRFGAISVLVALTCACSDNDTQFVEPVESPAASENPTPSAQAPGPCRDVAPDTRSQLQVSIAGFPESECFYADGSWAWYSQSVMMQTASGTWRREANGLLCVTPARFSRDGVAPMDEVCRVPPTIDETGTVFENLDRSYRLQVQVTGTFD